MGNEIFISYSRRDFDTVKAIKDQLDRELGIECWMDIDGIESGEQFEEVIVKAINAHEVFLFMLSPHSMASEYALDELAFAKRKGKRTVLLYITPCEMTDNFSFKYSKFDTIDWNNPLQHEKMMGNLRRWLNLAPKAATQTPKPAAPQPSSAAPQKIPVIDRSLSANELYNLGYNYANGKNGMLVNHEAAFLYYTASAEKGNAAAMCNLGFCYERGIGTPKDLQCATYWYRKAAEGGNPTAQCNIAYCYEAGMGVAKEPQKAFYWYNQAAAQGVVRAECCVAFCYEKGIGTPVDYTKAIERSDYIHRRRSRAIPERSSIWRIAMRTAGEWNRTCNAPRSSIASRRSRAMSMRRAIWGFATRKAKVCRRICPWRSSGTRKPQKADCTARCSTSACVTTTAEVRRSIKRRRCDICSLRKEKEMKEQLSSSKSTSFKQ